MMMMGIKIYYLGSPIPTCEYMRLTLKNNPRKNIEEYELKAKSVDVWVYLEIQKVMY